MIYNHVRQPFLTLVQILTEAAAWRYRMDEECLGLNAYLLSSLLHRSFCKILQSSFDADRLFLCLKQLSYSYGNSAWVQRGRADSRHWAHVFHAVRHVHRSLWRVAAFGGSIRISDKSTRETQSLWWRHSSLV